MIKKNNLIPRETDKVYTAYTPNPGDKDCLCSRCDKWLGEEEVPISIFINKGLLGEIILCNACASLD